MIFFLEYDRPPGKLISMRTFEETQRRVAQNEKLDRELALHAAGIDHEVVLLEAESESALRTGYRRYFEDMETLLHSTADVIEATGRR